MRIQPPIKRGATMPKYWLISNRAKEKDGFGSAQGAVTFWTSDKEPLDDFKNWTQIRKSPFTKMLIAAADAFPLLKPAEHERQSHLTLFVHGYNNTWQDAAKRYQKLCADLFNGPDGLGICVAFDWPSLGSVLGYEPDRSHAAACAGDLADLLSELYDWLLEKQEAAVADEKKACKAKVSLIAHSMGNYLLQKAASTAWTRKNRPLLASLMNQLIMVAADVDNDLFEPQTDNSMDGNALANLSYRITSLFSGRDAVLAASAGLKHFGARRLGRSGLAARPPTDQDNVWDVDCSGFFPRSVPGEDIHSAYFGNYGTLPLMEKILRGIDRTALATMGATKGTQWP